LVKDTVLARSLKIIKMNPKEGKAQEKNVKTWKDASLMFQIQATDHSKFHIVFQFISKKNDKV